MRINTWWIGIRAGKEWASNTTVVPATASSAIASCNHSFRATGITNFLENDGTVEKAQASAAHESPRTTKIFGGRDKSKSA